MADNNSITGSIVGKIRFNIDKKSWDNLELFQKKLTSIKRQMSSMDKTIKVQAVVNSVNKVTNAVVNAENKIVKNREANAKKVRKIDTNTSHLSLFTQNMKDHAQALRMNEQFDKQRLRQKERAEREYDKRREKLLNARANANAARSRRKAGAMSANEAYEARVEAFTTVKRNQLARTALMRGWKDDQLANAQSILTNNVNKFKAQFDGSKSGDIGNFRANVNGAVNQLSAMDAVTRRSAISLKSLRNELVQLTAAYTAFSVVQNVAQVGMEMEGLRASAKVFAKDDAGVAEHMGFIADEANRLGVNFQEAAKAFTKFSISSQSKFDKGTQRALFSGVSEYATILQLNKEEYQRFFKSIQQMSDKGLYAEEIYGQMAESAPGSVEALSKAFGYGQDTAAFRKRIEQGGLQLTPDKARAFATELSKVANSNGALSEATKKTRAEMERFFAALTFAKDELFQSGMGKGIADMFSTLSDTLEGLKPLTKALGGLFRGMVSVISGAIKLIITPVEILVNSISGLWNMLGFSDGTNSKIWAVIGAGGTLMLLVTRFKLIKDVVVGTNTALLALMANLARIVIPLLAIEDIYGGMNGKVSATGAGGRFSAQNILGDSFAWMDKPLNQLVTIEVKGDEAAKFIQTTVEKGNQSKTAATQSEVSQ